MAGRGGGRHGGAEGGGRAGPFASGLALLLLRLFAGALFFYSAWWKLVQPGFSLGEIVDTFRSEYVQTVQAAIANPPALLGLRLDLFASFLRDVMLPAAPVAAPALLFFEAFLGVSLLLGFGVRLFAALGVVMMLGYSLAKPYAMPDGGVTPGVPLLSVKSANWPLTFLLLALALLAAGRVVGLDARWRRDAPPWLRWIG